jgi:hypothetical protein
VPEPLVTAASLAMKTAFALFGGTTFPTITSFLAATGMSAARPKPAVTTIPTAIASATVYFMMCFPSSYR